MILHHHIIKVLLQKHIVLLLLVHHLLIEQILQLLGVNHGNIFFLNILHFGILFLRLFLIMFDFILLRIEHLGYYWCSGNNVLYHKTCYLIERTVKEVHYTLVVLKILDWRYIKLPLDGINKDLL